MIELSVVKLLLKRENYNKYHVLTTRMKLENEIYKILTCITKYYETYTHHEYISIDELRAYIYVMYPSEKNNEILSQTIDRLGSLEVSDSVAAHVVQQMLEKDTAQEIVSLLMPVLAGEKSDLILEVPELIADFKDRLQIVDAESNPFIDDDIEELLDLIDNTGGIKWRLEYLNDNLGPLTGGTVGHVFARVEAGKTSFIASEVSNWLTQLDDDEEILWVCNEEHGRRVRMRCWQSVLNYSREELFEYIRRGQAQYLRDCFAEAGGHRLHIHYDPNVSVETIRGLLEKIANPRFCIVDIADHVGFRGDHELSGPARLGELYRKYRTMASHYNLDMLTVGQASGECDGNKVLHLNHMHNSKTDKPGALDYAIGIGKTYNEEDAETRWLSLCKNKIGTTKREWEIVGFDSIHGRYYDV